MAVYPRENAARRVSRHLGAAAGGNSKKSD